MTSTLQLFEDMKKDYGFSLEDIPYLLFIIAEELRSIRETMRTKE